MTRSLWARWVPTSSWRPFGPLHFVLHALRALRPVGRARLRSGQQFLRFLGFFGIFRIFGVFGVFVIFGIFGIKGRRLVGVKNITEE